MKVRHTSQSIFGTLLSLQVQQYGGSYDVSRLPYLRSMLEADCGLPQSQQPDASAVRAADQNDQFGGLLG